MPMQGDDVLSLMMEEPAPGEDIGGLPTGEGTDVVRDAADGMIKAVQSGDADMLSSLLRDVIEMVILEGETAEPVGGPNVDLATA